MYDSANGAILEAESTEHQMRQTNTAPSFLDEKRLTAQTVGRSSIRHYPVAALTACTRNSRWV